ncbi:MAG: HPr family phosphocarrier protein [Clostridiales bacterium]|jgi:phosphocarrier protein|nr:HPr family phosphocarrier protein [Clostridiales bacterium]
MISRTLTIKTENGLHVRPAGALVSICRPFDADVMLKFNETEYNLKSVLGIVSAGIKYGDAVEFICIGAQAKEAMAAIEEAVESGLNDF